MESQEPHPYRPDKPRTAGALRRAKTGGRPMGLLIAAILEAWTAGYTAITAPSALGQFRELFEGFGANLPASTRMLVAMPWFWMPFALVAIGLLIWIGVTPQPTAIGKRRMTRALWMFGLVFGLSIGWAAIALYLPIFRLGAVV